MITCKYCGVMTNDNEHEKTCHSMPHVCETCGLYWVFYEDDITGECQAGVEPPDIEFPVDRVTRNKAKTFGCNFWKEK